MPIDPLGRVSRVGRSSLSHPRGSPVGGTAGRVAGMVQGWCHTVHRVPSTHVFRAISLCSGHPKPVKRPFRGLPGVAGRFRRVVVPRRCTQHHLRRVMVETPLGPVRLPPTDRPVFLCPRFRAGPPPYVRPPNRPRHLPSGHPSGSPPGAPRTASRAPSPAAGVAACRTSLRHRPLSSPPVPRARAARRPPSSSPTPATRRPPRPRPSPPARRAPPTPRPRPVPRRIPRSRPHSPRTPHRPRTPHSPRTPTKQWFRRDSANGVPPLYS
ncbi:hypothetical protein LRR80_01658 [Streptomyces sp. RO-S4]|nr:hypothetical protein [Streptomyces sp. RO-S4]